MKKALGSAIVLGFLLTLWMVGPVIAIALNAIFRPDYQLRDLATEYRARLRPNRVYWHDYHVYRMDCAAERDRRVVILHTTEFDERPTDFLARTHPGCSNFEREESDLWKGLHGILVGRW